MPSLLERVGRSLTRKKPEIITNNRDSVVTALEGFENVSPADVKGYVPPSATSPSQEKSQGAFQSFLRAKSPTRNAAPQTATAPLLSLHLPELSETGSSGTREKMSIAFEHQSDPAYTDEVVAAKRLSTAETLFLVQKTSSALAQKGLETPGIFKTFWHAQNPTSQRKLIIAFLQTLPINETAQALVADATAETKETTSALDTFTNLLHNTSPYDLAEVFKWAVRHFRNDGRSFGTSADEYGWYKTFAESEKTGSYPPDAYSTILAPLLPPAHLELLNSIFQLASSVAAYGEINGVSGSKLSRSVGWWLLSERLQPTNGLVGFLQDWDTAARILEHLFLAYVRDQQRLGLMPKRLTQLVKAYPYPKQANPTTDAYYLPRPKFSTQQRTVLFVRAAVPSNAIDFYHGRPIQLLKDAIVATPEDSPANADYRAIWESLKRQATAENNGPSEPSSPVDLTQGAPVVSVATLLSESGVHTLTSASGESARTSPVKATGDLESSWIRSFSPAAKKNSSVAGADSTNTTAPQSPMEWDDFTGMGFAGGLNDSTTLSFSDFAPPPSRQGSATVGGGTKSSKASRMSSRQRRSMEFGQRPRNTPATNGHGAGTPKTEDTKTFPNKDASPIISDSAEPPLEIDETLIDGWAEILTDKAVASRTWPTFALYELRNPLTVPVATTSVNGGPAEPNRIKWLAIETYVNTPPTREASVPSSPTKGGKVKRSSSVSSGKRARFGFFSSTTSLAGKDKEPGGKEEKKEKRKEHNRRTSEISTDSVGVKIKEPASRSQADLTAPPAIAEEPEPTTPVKVVPEEKAIPDTAVTEKEAEVFPAKDSAPAASTLAPINTLAVSNTDGSRFVEGGTPGTIPESVTTEPAPLHEDKSEVATTAVVGASAAGIAAATAATVLLKQDSGPNVPVSEDQTAPVNNAAIDTEVSAQPTDPIADESQQGQPSVPTEETIDSDAAALARAPEDAQLNAEEDAALEVQQREADDLERQRVLKEQEELEAQRLQDESRAEAARVEAARIEREQAELRAKEEEERARLELEEHARVEAAEKQAELDRLAALKAEEERLAAQKAEEERLAEIAREEEHLRLEMEERARVEAAEKQAEEERLAALKAEEDRLAAEKAEEERLAEIAREEERIRIEMEERARVEAAEKKAELDRLAALKAEEERLVAQKAEEERLAEIAREEERIRLEADERARVEAAEKQAELDRLAALKAEEDRLAAQKAEEERLAEIAREEERVRLEAEERARVEAAEKQAELDRLAALKAEEERLAAQKAEEERLAEIAREEKRIRLEMEERARVEAAEKQAELDRLAALKAEEERLAAEKAEEERLAEIVRLEAEELEKQRVAQELAQIEAKKREEARLQAEELERQRLAEEQAELERQETLAAAEKARIEAEELEKQRLAAELAAEEARKREEEEETAARLAAEEAEKQRIADELAAEEARKREEEEKAVRLATEKAESDRLAAEGVENQRIVDEQAAEEARIAEEARLEEERRLAAVEQERLDAEKAAAEAAVIPEPIVDTKDNEVATSHVITGDEHDHPATTEDAPVEVPTTTEDAPVEDSTKVEETKVDEPAV